MRFAFWKQLSVGLMVCGLAVGCGSEQDQLQDEKEDVQEAQQDLQEEKQDVRDEKMDDSAGGEAGAATDPSAEPNGLEPKPDDPDAPAVREEEVDSVPKEAGSNDGGS